MLQLVIRRQASGHLVITKQANSPPPLPPFGKSLKLQNKFKLSNENPEADLRAGEELLLLGLACYAFSK